MNKIFVLFIGAFLLMQGTMSWAAEKVSVAVFEQHKGFIKASTAYGLSWDILKLAAEEAQIELILQQTSWDGAISRLRNNKVELLFGVLKTPQRQTWLSFSYPLAPEASMLYTLPSNPVSTLSQIDVQQVRVGAVEKSQHQTEAVNRGFTQIYPVKDGGNLYQMLHIGRLDYVVLAATMARFYCDSESRDYGVDCLKPVGEVWMYSNVHVASFTENKQTRKVLARLNQGIKAVYQSPGISALFRQHGFTKQEQEHWQQQMNALISTQ